MLLPIKITHALCVGVDKYKRKKGYEGMDLRGCVNDRNAMWKNLKKARGKKVKVRVLSNSTATSKNIFKRLKEMLEKLQSGETGLFYFSGHGTQYPDFSNDEADGLDECLCCYKTMFGDIIFDDEIRHIVQAYKKRDTQIIMIYDCCHSGTQAMSFPSWVTKYDGVKKAVDIEAMGVKARSKDITEVNKENSQHVIVLSGCKDEQYSYEVKLPNGKFRGLLTTLIEKDIKALVKGKKTLKEIHETAVKEIEKIGYHQTPQINIY